MPVFRQVSMEGGTKVGGGSQLVLRGGGMSDWNDKLSPLMKERLARIGEVAPAEKERLKAFEELGVILSDFFSGRMDSDGLWSKLKEYKDSGKDYVLKEAQIRLIDSMVLGTTGDELRKRKEGIIGVESLKKHQNTSVLERGFDALDGLHKQYKDELEEVYKNVKSQVERNPQLRMQQVRQGQTMMVTQLSVEEAVKNLPEWRSFLAQHEARYSQEFAKLVADMKTRIK